MRSTYANFISLVQLLGYFWLMQLFPGPKICIRQELSVLINTNKLYFKILSCKLGQSLYRAEKWVLEVMFRILVGAGPMLTQALCIIDFATKKPSESERVFEPCLMTVLLS